MEYIFIYKYTVYKYIHFYVYLYFAISDFPLSSSALRKVQSKHGKIL